MARPYTPEINRLVRYKKANGWWRNGIITSILNSTTVTIRFGHSAGTAVNVVKQTAHGQTNVWKPW